MGLFSFRTNELKHILLCGQSFIYLIAFASLYWQIPGLYGERGLLPIATKLDCKHESVLNCPVPVLQAFHRYLTLRPSLALHLLCLCGIVLSSLSILFKHTRNAVTYFALYILYLNAFEAGGTFLWFQWDTLLLESGFLFIIVAAFGDSPVDSISIFLVRWLACRLMFASGVVKLQSGCPTWWGLTALDIHYESQCIPTPASWYFHHMPEWIRRFSVAMTFYIEIYLPPMFLLPLQPLRQFACLMQFVLMAAIMVTGNYNFFNLHYMLLCVAMLEIESSRPTWRKVTEMLLSVAIAAASIAHFIYAFNITVDLQNLAINSNIGFKRPEFDRAIKITTSAIIHTAIIMLIWKVLTSLYRCVYPTEGKTESKRWILHFLFVIILGSGVFWVSMVPFTTIDRSAANRIPTVLRKLHENVKDWQIVNSYGLFRRMTGAEGRPEIVVEASDGPNGPWTEFHFYSKPGNLTNKPIFVLPHQPRLDWQMWFAALGTYQQNPFFISLIHHLLENTTDVTRLMGDFPFQDKEKAPQFIRAKLYFYRFTKPTEKRGWWTRSYQEEYMPVLSKRAAPIVDFLKQQGILFPGRKFASGKIGQYLAKLHRYVYKIDQTVFVWSVLGAHIVIVLSRKLLRF